MKHRYLRISVAQFVSIMRPVSLYVNAVAIVTVIATDPYPIAIFM